jgi:hypothetical protein
MQRGKQYIRGIKMYYKKFHSYPPSVDLLVKPNGLTGIRFIRKKYLDPITGKDDWKPIQFGQNKAPTAMGFFGQPLGGMGMGMGMGGGGIAGAQTLGSPLTPSLGMGSTDSGSTSTFGASSIGSTDTSATGSPSGGPGNTGAIGTPAGSSPLGGQTFGGLGIIGFSPVGDKQSILVYKKKNHYNEWEFVYDPLTEMMGMPATQPQPGANVPGQIGAPGANGTGGFGGQGGGFNGPGGGFGSSGSSFGNSGGSQPPPSNPPNN